MTAAPAKRKRVGVGLYVDPVAPLRGVAAGIRLAQALRARDTAVKIILFTAYPDHAALDAALAAGAHGALVKDTERDDLVDAIRRVNAGFLVGHSTIRRVAMGETNPEIAVALGLTRNTVKTYLQRSLEKLGARNRVEALSRASQLGIL